MAMTVENITAVIGEDQNAQCTPVDVQQMEHLSLAVQQMVVNFDISNMQFDAEKMYQEAQKVGLDIGDLEDYGFDISGANCGGMPCFNKDKLKTVDEFKHQSTRMGQ